LLGEGAAVRTRYAEAERRIELGDAAAQAALSAQS
jgi:hypothetical protein